MRRLPNLLLLAVGISLRGMAFESVHDLRTWAITGLTIVDVETGQMVPDQTILIQGGVIRAVGDRRSMPAPDVVVSDQAGRYAIPGLWDMHVHLRGGPALIDANERWLRQYLGFGVTSIREMGGDLPHSVLHWKAEVGEGFIVAPRIYSALQKLDGPGARQSGSIPVESRETLDDALDYLAASGADFVKLYDYSFPALLFPVAIRAAAARGLKTAAHVSPRVPFEDVIDAGLGSVEHSFFLLKAGNPDDRRSSADLADIHAEDYLTYFDALGDVADNADEAHARRVFRSMAARGTAITGTLQIDRRIYEFLSGRAVDDARLEQAPGLIRASDEEAREYFAEIAEEALSSQEKIVRVAFPLLRVAAEEGVMILAGSDTGVGNPFVYPGDSLHGELEIMVELGFSPLEALQTATRNAARWMGLADEIGALAPGMKADLVILDANPLADIANSRSVTAVAQQGVYFDAAELAGFRALVGE